MLEFSPDAIVIVDADGRIREWNLAAASILDSPDATAVSAPLRNLLSSPHRERFEEAWLQLFAGHAIPRVRDLPGVTNGPAPAVDVTVAPIWTGDVLAGAVVILRDPSPRATPRVEGDQDLGFEPPSPTVEHDGPAGLPGRHWLQRRLSAPLMAGCERGVAVFDIDAFTVMVSTYGPDAADAALNEFAQLLKSLDTQGEFAHWRADSFAWIVDTANPIAALDDLVAQLTRALEKHFLIGDDRVWLTLSVGLATTTLTEDGDLLAAASDALQAAKHSGGSTASYYDESMEAGASSGYRLANELHQAISHDELILHYQPIVELATNEIVGVEALVRWERPGVGTLAPGFFIEAAERTGQIVPLGNWVVRTACSNALLLGNHSGGPRTMSINISARQLQDSGLIATLRDAMKEGRCVPSTIIIEVTESVLVDDLSTIAASLEAIKALGVGIDLDDFGTGYSSLQYLRNLPIDRLKVDQGFVAGLGVNGADTAIVASTIALAHALGMRSIAEGVETTEQLALLREMGCDFAQGYLLSRPADMEAFTAWLDAYVPAEVVPRPEGTNARLTRQWGDATDLRDKKADRRDRKADMRETKANSRDSIATDRDNEANVRDADANARDETATARDVEANTREAAADEREHKMAERERAEDERERAEDERERAEDERERASEGPGETNPSS